jgi:hypothetical protein
MILVRMVHLLLLVDLTDFVWPIIARAHMQMQISTTTILSLETGLSEPHVRERKERVNGNEVNENPLDVINVNE